MNRDGVMPFAILLGKCAIANRPNSSASANAAATAIKAGTKRESTRILGSLLQNMVLTDLGFPSFLSSLVDVLLLCAKNELQRANPQVRRSAPAFDKTLTMGPRAVLQYGGRCLAPSGGAPAANVVDGRDHRARVGRALLRSPTCDPGLRAAEPW